MAASVEFNTPAQYLTRTTNLPSHSAVSFGAWVKIISYENWLDTFSLEGVSDGDYLLIESNASGEFGISLKQAYTLLGEFTFWADAHAGWAYIAFAENTAGGMDVYRRYEAESTLTLLGTIPAASYTPVAVRIAASLNFFADNNGTLRICAAKLWDRKLTQAELLAESNSRSVVDATNLNWSNGCSSASTVEVAEAGSGGNFTKVGTPTTANDEPNVFAQPLSIGALNAPAPRIKATLAQPAAATAKQAWTLAPLTAAPSLGSISWLASLPTRSREPVSPLRIVSANDYSPPQSLPAIVPDGPPVRTAAPIPRRPVVQQWALAALVPLALSSAFELAAPPARAAAPSPRRAPAATWPLKPVRTSALANTAPQQKQVAPQRLVQQQPFPLVPLNPFPSAAYVPNAERARTPLTPPVQPLQQSWSLPPLAVEPALATALGNDLPQRAGTQPLPSPSFGTWTLAPLAAPPFYSDSSFDLCPPPQVARAAFVARPWPVDAALLPPLPPLAPWADLAGLPTRGARPFQAVLPTTALPPAALPAVVLAPWAELAAAPTRGTFSAPPPLARTALPPSALPAAVLAPWADFGTAARSNPERTRRTNFDSTLLTSTAAPPPSFDWLPNSQPVRAGSTERRPVAFDSPVLSPFAPSVAAFDARAVVRAATRPVQRQPQDAWSLTPIAAAPSSWAEFCAPPVRSRISITTTPTPPVWFLTGVSDPIRPVFIDSGSVVFVPFFPRNIVPEFIPSTSEVFRPSFQYGVSVPFIPSVSEVFRPQFIRRPEYLREMIPAFAKTPFIVPGPAGRLVLAPLPDKDARHQALDRFAQFLRLITFRRTAGVGAPEHVPFRLDKPGQITFGRPDDVGAEAPLPSIAILPGTGTHDSMGIGGAHLIDDSYGVYGDGTALIQFGEYLETFTLEIVAPKRAERRAIISGLLVLLRMNPEWDALLLSLPDYFDAIAEFDLESSEYIEDNYASQNRRVARLRVNLSVPEVWVASGVAMMKPRLDLDASASMDLGAEVDVEVE